MIFKEGDKVLVNSPTKNIKGEGIVTKVFYDAMGHVYQVNIDGKKEEFYYFNLTLL